ncbi:MAG: DNA helicase RecG, partial [Clostridiales bacterium]
RMAYEEWLILQMAISENNHSGELQQPVAERPVQDDREILARFSAALPFALTAAQQRVIHEIYDDLNRPQTMARLIQGDVGCGKTVVAAAALLKTCLGGR